MIKPTWEYRLQQYAACQLVAAINARIYLGGGDVSDDEFERLVDVTLCRYGAALRMEKAVPELGLTALHGELSLEWIAAHLPVAVSTHEIEHHGFHQILVVQVDGDMLGVVNFYKPRLTWHELVDLQPPPHVRQCIAYTIEKAPAARDAQLPFKVA